MSGTGRVLVLVGGVFHDFDGFGRWVKPLLEGQGYQVEVTTDLDRLCTVSVERYDLVLSYTCLSTHRDANSTWPERLSEAQTSALVEWVRAGGGFFTVHSGTVSGKPNPIYSQLAGARFLEHPPRFSFTVYPLAVEHPITRGIQAMTVWDEFYIQAYEPDIQVLMVAMDRGVAYPMVWAKTVGLGRVAHVAMGHDGQVWRMPAYERLFLQAVEWCTRQGA